MDFLRALLFLLALITLSRIHVYLGLAPFRPALVLVMIAGLTVLFKPELVRLRTLLAQWPPKVVTALALLACLSAGFGLSLGGSATFILETYGKTLLLFFLLAAATRHAPDLRLFSWGFVLSAGIIAYYALFVFQIEGSGFARLDDMYTYDSNDAACVMVTAIPITILLFQTSAGKGKLLAALLLFGIGGALARSGSRGGFLGLMVVGVALITMVPGISLAKRLALPGVVLVGLLVLAPLGYWEQMRTLTTFQEDYNWTDRYGRRQLAERGMGYMLQYPLFGIGVDNFRRAEGTISDMSRLNKSSNVRWRPVHNSFVQVGAEMGIPGLVLWSSLIFGGIIGLRRLRRRLPRAWLRARRTDQEFVYRACIYLPAALAGFATSSFFVSFAYMDVTYVLAALVTGVYVAAATLRIPAATVRSRARTARVKPAQGRPLKKAG